MAPPSRAHYFSRAFLFEGLAKQITHDESSRMRKRRGFVATDPVIATVM